MAINLLQWLLYGLGILSAFVALRMLWRRPGSLRALAWAIGCIGLLAASVLTLLAAADLGRYQSVVPGAVIATVNIDQQTRDPEVSTSRLVIRRRPTVPGMVTAYRSRPAAVLIVTSI